MLYWDWAGPLTSLCWATEQRFLVGLVLRPLSRCSQTQTKGSICSVCNTAFH